VKKMVTVGAIGLLAGLAFLFSCIYGDDVRPASQGDSDPSSGERVTNEPEKWIRDLAKDGEALVRVPVVGKDEVREERFKSLGPLSPSGVKLLLAVVDEEIQSAEQEVYDEKGGGEAEAPVGRYARELRRIRQVELLRARRSQILSGAYITVPMQGSDPPPIPKNVSQWRGGPFPLDSGGQCLIIVWVDVSRRPEISSVDAAVKEVMLEESDEALRRFQSMPFGDRARWVGRFQELVKKREVGVDAMSVEELEELSAMRAQLSHMRATVDPANSTLFRLRDG